MITAEWTNRDNLSIETTGQNSKAILVIDMPKSCRECRLYRPYEYRQAVHCAGNFRNINFSDSETDKPSWCPLRPLPPQKKNSIVYQGEVNVDISIEFLEKIHNQGYNDCLEEIMGDDKDEV